MPNEVTEELGTEVDAAARQPAAPTVVWLHGSGDSSQIWRSVIECLPEIKSVTLDLPGHGALYERPGPERMSVGDYADAVRAELTRRGLRHVCLVGHSLGSAITLRLALDQPALIQRIVLVGAGARLRVLPTLLTQAHEDPRVAQTALESLAFAPGHEALCEAVARDRAPLAPGMLHRDLAACDAFDMMADLKRIAQPALIITGEHDRLTPPKYATYLCESLEDAHLEVIPGAGHYVMVEEPARVANAVRRFLGVEARHPQPTRHGEA